MFSVQQCIEIMLQIAQRVCTSVLFAMRSLHILNFILMVTMVADFCSLAILIHNRLLGEITISSPNG